MFLSVLVLFVIVYGIKKYASSDKDPRRTNITDFNLSRVNQIVKKKNTPLIKKVRKKMQKRLKALKPVINNQLGGPSFGIDIGGLADLNLEEDLLNNDDIVMDESSVDIKPKILSQKGMEYPDQALKDNVLAGFVELRLLINKDGEVGQTQILKAQPKGYFEEVAIAGVQKWKFAPATYRGRNVAIWATQVVRFGQ